MANKVSGSSQAIPTHGKEDSALGRKALPPRWTGPIPVKAALGTARSKELEELKVGIGRIKAGNLEAQRKKETV